VALGVGIVSLLWGCFGLAQAGLFTMAQVWCLPGTKRPNYWVRLARSLMFLAFLGASPPSSNMIERSTQTSQN